ncbi:GGDEF domain-containing protein [Corticibacterium sp. UT-5YL-CI-8]|nr:GGDEF domain-containing protein [Tianweitania sp. UT-5YL-CI-8]
MRVSYQAPFAVATALAALAVLWPSRRHRQPSDFALALVLAVSSAQFLAKSLLAHQITTGPNVQSYILSTYAHFSQTAAAVLSLLLGIVLLVVVTGEMLASTRASLQRDELSGLWNRGAFLERARAALAEKNGGQACVILSDLDRFKTINDRYGHAAGDEVIAAFGACLQSSATLGICGRLGGEEFGVFKHDSSPARARVFVEKVRLALQQSSFALVQGRVTASFGIAFVAPNEPLEFALRRADTALYRAKAEGRDSFRFAEPPRNDPQFCEPSVGGGIA